MADFWAFLSDETNRSVLTWIGGGIAGVAAIALAAIPVFGGPARTRTDITINQRRGLGGGAVALIVGVVLGIVVLVGGLWGDRVVTASNGGVAVGAAVRGSTIITNGSNEGEAGQ